MHHVLKYSWCEQGAVQGVDGISRPMKERSLLVGRRNASQFCLEDKLMLFQKVKTEPYLFVVLSHHQRLLVDSGAFDHSCPLGTGVAYR